MRITRKQLKQLIKEHVSAIIMEQVAGAAALAPGARPRAGTEANPIEGPEIRITGRRPAPAPAPAAPGGNARGARGNQRYEAVVRQMMTLRNNMEPRSNQLLAVLQQIRAITTGATYDEAAQQQVSTLISRARRAASGLNGQIENIRNSMDSVRNGAGATAAAGAAMGARERATNPMLPGNATARGVGDLAGSAMNAAASAPGTIPSEMMLTLTPQQIENLTSMTRLLDGTQRQLSSVVRTLSFMQQSIADAARITRLNPHLNWRQVCAGFVGDPVFNTVRPAATVVGATGASGETLAVPVAENRKRSGKKL